VRIVAGLPYQEELQNLVRLKNALGRKAARLSIAGNLPEASTIRNHRTFHRRYCIYWGECGKILSVEALRYIDK